MTTYRITVSFLDDGLHMVQAEGDPYPLGMFKETGYELALLLDGAQAAIERHRMDERYPLVSTPDEGNDYADFMEESALSPPSDAAGAQRWRLCFVTNPRARLVLEREPDTAGQERHDELVEADALGGGSGDELGVKAGRHPHEDAATGGHEANDITGAIDTSDSACDITPMPKTARQYKFDRGDWIAVRDHHGEWLLAGKVVDADSDSCTIVRRDGTRDQFIPESDPIARVRWVGRGKWALA